MEILFPVFGLMVLGGALRHGGFLNSAMEAAFNRFCYFVSLPVFIVLKIAQSPLLDSRTAQTSLAIGGVTLGLWLAGMILASLFRVPRRSRGTFVQCGFRGNLAYVGLPVLFHALADRSEAVRSAAGAEAMLTLGGVVLLYNLLAVGGLEWDRRHDRAGHPLLTGAKATATNPLILACVIGLIWNVTRLPIPDVLSRTMLPIGQTAFPLALLAIGSRIRGLKPAHFGLPALGVCVLKNLLAVLLGVGMCHVLGVSGTSRLIVLILCACPTAVASYVLVDQLDGDRDLAATGIALTAVMSVFSLIGALTLGLP